MKLVSGLGVVCWLAFAAVPFGCSSEDDEKKAPGLDGGSDGRVADGGAGLLCGSKVCAPTEGAAAVGMIDCCTAQGECGLKHPSLDKCLPPGDAGILSTTCGELGLPDGGTTLSGCCTPSGCGKMVPFLGCVQNAEFGQPSASCAYDPSNDCQTVAAIPCDGPEDCPTGQRCCTDLAAVGPKNTGCYDSCEALGAGSSTATWRELCHAGGACENSGYQCRVSQYLPSWLARCYTDQFGGLAPGGLDTSEGQVNCGGGTCGSGQQCCHIVSRLGEAVPYCAPAGSDCRCHAPDGGRPEPRPDAGAPTGDGGRPDAAPMDSGPADGASHDAGPG